MSVRVGSKDMRGKYDRAEKDSNQHPHDLHAGTTLQAFRAGPVAVLATLSTCSTIERARAISRFASWTHVGIWTFVDPEG